MSEPPATPGARGGGRRRTGRRSAVPEVSLDAQRDADGDAEPADVLSVGDPVTLKTRVLASACSTCIFRRNGMVLAPGGLRDIVDQALHQESYIVCHSTLPGMYPNTEPAICRGFFDRYATQAIQVIGRLFGFTYVPPPHDSNTPDH